MVRMNTKLLLGLMCFAMSTAYTSSGIGIVPGAQDGNIYSFTFTGQTTTPATMIFSGFSRPDCVGFSPDGATAYVTDFQTSNGLIYRFPTAGPYTATTLTTTIHDPIDLVISNDGQTAYVTGDQGFYYFPTSGPYTATTLTPSNQTPDRFCGIAIDSTGTLYTTNFKGQGVYVVTTDLTNNTYDASSIASLSMLYISSVAVSSDGYLYLGAGNGPESGNVYRVPLNDLNATPTLVATGTLTYIDGVSISADGTTGFVGSLNNGVYTFTTDSLPSAYQLTNVGVTTLLSLGIITINIPPTPTPTPPPPVIPLGGLSGNNLAFAEYINNYAPQDASYFVAAALDGTLAQALESAAPTRNAFSLYTASNNLFYLTTNLSNHLHNGSRHRRTGQTQIAAASTQEVWNSEELLASNEPDDRLVSRLCQQKMKRGEKSEEKKNSIWFEAIGALAYQKAQHQTPGFDPITGGGILAFDGKTSKYVRVGAGAAYLYTHIHEDQGAGHSNINQEDLFVYASWENKHVYLDGSVLGGLFQINQVRDIKMSGFEFKSTSKPHGWQLLPHLELGYHYTWPEGIELTINPFIMVDWANAWQKSFKEKGSGPFNAEQKSHHSSLLRSEASLRMYETVFFDSWDLIFQEKAGYVNVHSSRTGNVNAFLVGSPGSFTVTTLTGNQNLGVAEFAMIFAPHTYGYYPTSTLFYQGEFGSKYQSHQVALELAWNF